MGCFETTCALSGLTLHSGAPTRAGLIFLYSNENATSVYRNSVSWMSMPLWGTCDDYGRVIVDDDPLTTEIIKNRLEAMLGQNVDLKKLQGKIQDEGSIPFSIIWMKKSLGYCVVREDVWRAMVSMEGTEEINEEQREFIRAYFSNGTRPFDRFPDSFSAFNDVTRHATDPKFVINDEFVERVSQSVAVYRVMDALNMGWTGATNLGSQHETNEMRALWFQKMFRIASQTEQKVSTSLEELQYYCNGLEWDLDVSEDPAEWASLCQKIGELKDRIRAKMKEKEL